MKLVPDVYKRQASCFYKPRNRDWAGGILKMLHEEHGGNDEIVTIGLTLASALTMGLTSCSDFLEAVSYTHLDV